MVRDGRARAGEAIPDTSPPHRAVILGIDGGGSKTVALLADAGGAVLGRGAAGGGNVRAGGMEAAAAAILAAVAQAYERAGLPRHPARAVCLGLAGAGRPAERALVERWALGAGLAAHTLVCSDAQLVLAAGLPYGAGVALVAGAGSIALGRTADGRSARAGGWGPLLGDEGSGRDIARAGLHAACRAADGRGPDTQLLPSLLEHWGLARPEHLIPHLSETPDLPALLVEVPPLITALAESGDTVAQTILADAGEELAAAAASVARQLGLGPALPLALAGGVLVNSGPVRAAALRALRRRGLVPEPILVPEPARGALTLAAALAAGEETNRPPKI